MRGARSTLTGIVLPPWPELLGLPAARDHTTLVFCRFVLRVAPWCVTLYRVRYAPRESDLSASIFECLGVNFSTRAHAVRMLDARRETPLFWL